MLKNVLRMPAVIGVLFVASIGLLLAGTIGTAMAVPRIVSQDYRAEVVLTNIDTALTEQGKIVEGEDTLLNGFPWDGSAFAVGNTYDELLAVRNVADSSKNGISQYVRVTVYKYWVDETGAKVNELDPSLIDLHFVEGNGWTIDHASDTRERTVLYYATPISTGQDTTPFADTLRIDPAALTATATGADGAEIAYDGKRFIIKAVVDAVQTHNPTEAMTSAWGRTNEK